MSHKVNNLEISSKPKRRTPIRRRDPESIKKTEEMVEMYRAGNTYQQIGDHYGIIKQAVAARLKKAGEPRSVPLYRRINRKRLDALFTIERLPLEQIAVRLKTTLWSIKKAIKYYQLPPRSPLDWLGGIPHSRIANLAVGDSVRVKSRAMDPLARFEAVARYLNYGLRISPVEKKANHYDVKRLA